MLNKFFVYKPRKLSHLRQREIPLRAVKFFSLCLFAYLGLQFPHVNVNSALSYLTDIFSWQRRQQQNSLDILLFFCLSCYFMPFIQINEVMLYFVFLPQVQLTKLFRCHEHYLQDSCHSSIFPSSSCGRLKMAVNFLSVPPRWRISFSKYLKLD